MPPTPTVIHACANGDANAATRYEFLVGGFAATLFTSAYVLVPLLLILVPLMLLLAPTWWLTWLVATPFLASAVLPPLPSRSFLRTWPFKHMPSYFNYSEIKELSDDGVQALIGERAVLFCVQPHGVFTFGGACAGVEWSRKVRT